MKKPTKITPITRTIKFYSPDVMPGNWGNAEYLLLVTYLGGKKEDIPTEDMLIALWEDGKWWIKNNDYEPDELETESDGTILQPVLFTPFGIGPDAFFKLIGWSPLWGVHPDFK